MKPPREHGFWVMLGVALLAGWGAVPSLPVVLAALGIAGGTTLCATLVGRRIRKNELLQVCAAAAMGALVIPLTLVGGLSANKAIALAIGLVVVFVSTTMSVQAVLVRARKRFSLARRLSVGAVALACGVSAASFYFESPTQGAGVGLAALSSAAFLLFPPSAKRLKRVGLTVAVVQLSAALLFLL